MFEVQEQASSVKGRRWSSEEKKIMTSPRTISTSRLHTLPHVHLKPINRVIFPGPY